MGLILCTQITLPNRKAFSYEHIFQHFSIQSMRAKMGVNITFQFVNIWIETIENHLTSKRNQHLIQHQKAKMRTYICIYVVITLNEEIGMERKRKMLCFLGMQYGRRKLKLHKNQTKTNWTKWKQNEYELTTH